MQTNTWTRAGADNSRKVTSLSVESKMHFASIVRQQPLVSWLKHLCLIEKPMRAPVTEREGDSDQTSGSVMSKPEAVGFPAGTPRWPSPYEPPAAKQKKTWPLIAAVWTRDAPQAVMTLFALFSVVTTAKNKVEIWPTAPKDHSVNYYKIWKCWKKMNSLQRFEIQDDFYKL